MEITSKDDSIRDENKKDFLTIEDKIDNLIRALDENTAITKKVYSMLESNNRETDYIYKEMKVSMTASQQWKNFLLGVLANLVADFIAVKELFGMESGKGRDIQRQLNNIMDGRERTRY